MPDGAPGVVPSLLGGYARGVAWTYLGVLLSGASTFFLTAWSVRRVGTAEFGQFAVVASLAGLVAMLDYAVGLAVQRASARVEAAPAAAAERDAVHAAHGAFAVVGVALAALAGGLGAVLVVAAPARMPRLGATVALFGLATALQMGTAALPAVAAGCRRFALRAPATVAGVAVRVLVAVLAVGRLGVPGLALAHLLGVAADRALLLALLRRRVRWFVARPAAPDRAALRAVVAYAVPLLVLNVSAQVLVVSDLVVVGAVVGASAVGVYQVAALLPLQMAGFLMIGHDVAFPALAGSDDPAGQESATAFLTRVFSFVGGTGLALATVLRADVVRVMLGRPSPLAEKVVAVTCAACLANLMLHGLVSLLIARGEQAAMARLVAVELPVNAVLTVSFVLALGAVGAAVATLATVALMNFVVFPLVCGDRFSHTVVDAVARNGVVPAAAGAAVALAAAAAAGGAGGGAGRLLAAAALAGFSATAAGLVLLGPGGRATLRHAVAAARPPLGDPAPAVAR